MKDKIENVLNLCKGDEEILVQNLESYEEKGESVSLIFNSNEEVKKACKKYAKLIQSNLDPAKVNFIFIKAKSSAKEEQKVQIKRSIPNVNKCIAVISGKGGVGKSTVAAYLSLALSKSHRVSLFDADVYGPSLGRMMNVRDEPILQSNCLIPPSTADKIKFMSVSLIIEEAEPLMWRGPIVSRMINKILYETRWEHRSFLQPDKQSDFLVIDTPPGTGDVLITLLKEHKIDCALVVSTPQDVAIDSVKKSVRMLKKLNVPVVGILENMSGLTEIGEKNIAQTDYAPFGGGSIKKYAKEEGIPYMGALPITKEISHEADKELSLKSLKNNAVLSQIFDFITDNIVKFCSGHSQ